MNCDIVFTHPDNVLFPIWMNWINDHRKEFNRILVSIHKKHIDGWDFTPEIKTWAKTCDVDIFEPEVNHSIDWRNLSVNHCLDNSSSEWILFLEGDFFVKNIEKLFKDFELHIPHHKIAGYAQGTRLHPSFLLVDREIINKTSRDFSPIETDHFGKFSREILKEVGDYYDLDMLHNGSWFHMNGLTQNYTLVQLGEKPNHDIPSFMLYNITSLDLKYPRYNELCHLAEQSLTGLGAFI